MLKKYVLSAIFFLSTSGHCAEFVSVERLLQMHAAYDKAMAIGVQKKETDAILFIGFMQGVHDSSQGISHCTPTGISLIPITEISMNYVLRNPEYWNKPATFLIRAALLKAFPCDK